LTEHQNQLFKMLENPNIHVEDKFRLSLIYALRYEEVPQNRMGEIKDSLKKLVSSNAYKKLSSPSSRD